MGVFDSLLPDFSSQEVNGFLKGVKLYHIFQLFNFLDTCLKMLAKFPHFEGKEVTDFLTN
jgi:hypothetical protein